MVSHALCYKRMVSFDGSCFLFISSCYNSVVLLYGKSIMGGPSMFLTRKRWLVFELCNFLLLFTEEPEMNRWWTTVRWTSSWTRSSFWQLHWPWICHFICQAERSVSWLGHLRPLSLSHKHTHTFISYHSYPQPGLLCFRALNLWWHHFSDIIASIERKVN